MTYDIHNNLIGEEASENNSGQVDEQANSVERSAVTTQILNMEVPMTSKELLVSKIGLNGEPLYLDDDDKTRLARELAEVDDFQFEQILNNSWEEYLTIFPHVKDLADKISILNYNPIFDPPPHKELFVLPNYGAVASVSPQHESLKQAFSIGEQRQLLVTQMLTSRYKELYRPLVTRHGKEDLMYRVWAHEAAHTYLNKTYGKIVDVADEIEKENDPGHLTVGTDCGEYGAITAFQEAIVEMAASEMLGLEVTSIPDVLLQRGNVTIQRTLLSEAEQLYKEGGDESKPVSEIVGDLWYASELREDVRKMCRAIIEARNKGVNPLELGDRVNQVILTTLEGNSGMRHRNYTYKQLTQMINFATELGDVNPSMPLVDITPQNLDVFVHQREVLSNIIAREWYEVAVKE